MHVSKDLMWWRESEKTWNLNKALLSDRRKYGGQAGRLHGHCACYCSGAWASKAAIPNSRRSMQPGLCSRQDLSFPSSLRPGSACSSLPTNRPAMAILAPFCSPRRPLQHQIEPAAQSRHYSADSTCTPDAICFICCNCKRQREAAEGRVRWCTS